MEGSTPSTSAGKAVDLLLTMGREVLGRDPGRAVECFREAAQLAQSLGDDTSESRARQLVGATEVDRGHWDAAEEQLERALELARSADDSLAVATSLNSTGLLRMRQGRTDDARNYLREALSRTTESADDDRAVLVRAETLETLGLVDRETGEPGQAFLYYQEALETRRAAGDEPGIASCQNQLGNLCYRMGRFQDAVAYFELAIDKRRALADRLGTASTANNLASTFMVMGKLRDSAELFDESRRIAEELGETRRLASIQSNLGLLRSYQGRVDEAQELHEESLRLYREGGDDAGQAHALNNLANLAVERGRPEDAIRHAEECVTLWRDAGRKGNIAKPLVNKGEALLELGLAPQAREAAEEALEAAKIARSDEYQAEAASLLASALLREGRLNPALEAARKALKHGQSSGSPQLEANGHTLVGRVQAGRGELEDAKLQLESASRLLRGIKHPWERARLQAEQGNLLVRIGANEAGAERLRRALREFETLGNARWRMRVLLDLAAAVDGIDTAQQKRCRDEAHDLARLHGLEELLSEVEARRSGTTRAPTDEMPGINAAAFDEFVSVLLTASTGDAQSAADLIDPFFHFLRRQPQVSTAVLELGETASRRLRRAGPLPDGSHFQATDDDDGRIRCRLAPADETANAAETLEISVGVPDDPSGHLRLARNRSFPDGEAIWLTAVARVFALALESRLERLDRTAVAVSAPGTLEGFEGFIGRSRPMQEVYRLIELVAPTDSVALLLGESGTGKELAARAVHDRSRRKDGPFVAINCPSIPRELIESELFGHEKGAFTGADVMRPGKVELADDGTLFLDEVGDMSMATQVKLLRFLEEKEFQRVGGQKTLKVNLRILAATSRNLNEAIQQGTFREDLYYRLNVVPIRLPSLRERLEDVPELAEHLIARLTSTDRGTPPRISAGAMEILTAYDWPGNVRELRNTLEYMMTLGRGELLDERHVPDPVKEGARGSRGERPAAPTALPGLRAGETLESRLQQMEAALVRNTLESEDWNQSAAARRLGITESKIRNRMKQYAIRRPDDD